MAQKNKIHKENVKLIEIKLFTGKFTVSTRIK